MFDTLIGFSKGKFIFCVLFMKGDVLLSEIYTYKHINL